MLPVEIEPRSKAHRLTDAARARWYALTATSVGDARAITMPVSTADSPADMGDMGGGTSSGADCC
eukprot:jgi/Chrpa1/14142/Chrysochromulina_OHIO_Genome00020734-RA